MSYIKKAMMAQYFFCDICKKEMHLVNETRSAQECRKLCVHTEKFDTHLKCFEKLMTGDKNDQ